MINKFIFYDHLLKPIWKVMDNAQESDQIFLLKI